MSAASASSAAEAASVVAPVSADVDETIESLNPSHILQDGRYIYLPPPTDKERTQFFERSIARYGLLQDDLGETKKKSIKEEEEKVEKREKEEPKVHPLALASARLQADGINELNRAINLSGLVSTGEYFSMTNIVDPSLELPSAAAAETAKSSAEAATSDSKAAAAAGAGATSAKSESAMEVQEEQRVKASYVLKRKRLQFQKASTVLQRNQRRLEAAIVAQARPDTRLRQLRPCWRLCAPEHGSRALPHATRPTEAVACDVDVYLKGSGEVLGRLASHVPRYATIELKEDYTVQDDLAKWKEQFFPENDSMDVDEAEGESKEESKQNGHTWTTAEPFAIADPTVGKLDADFDPKKVAMLSLWFDIEKPSTGFRQSASLEPISALAASQEYSGYQQDEKTLVALQHSLFCAKLFESIRRELAPDTEDIVSLLNSSNTQSVVWLSGESETNFLPPPSQMSGDRMCGLPPLCVVHCHEGEVKVQLDCEYTLRVRLVEAEDPTANQQDDGMDVDSPVIQSAGSGSQSPEQLSILCRALLLHAQERYHKHSIRAAERLRKMAEEEKEKPDTHMRKKESVSSPRILQSCVSLGSKLLFEHRIRQTLKKVGDWLVSRTDEHLNIEWLSLSVFDMHAQFTVTFQSWVIDASMASEELTVTSSNGDGDYRKVKFHSDVEFELYLKLALGRLLKGEQSS